MGDGKLCLEKRKIISIKLWSVQKLSLIHIYRYNKRETVNLIVTEKLFFIINEDKNAGYENCIVQWI